MTIEDAGLPQRHERRTNAAKRRDVGLALAAWPELSDRALASRAGVSHEFVRRERTRCQPSTPAARRTGADGKSYPATGRRGAPARERRGCGPTHLGDGPPTVAAAATPGPEPEARAEWDRLPPTYH